jgi:hypothetical protein
VLFNVKQVQNECNNWQSCRKAFTDERLSALPYEHFSVFYSKEHFTLKTPQQASVKEGNISSADSRKQVLKILATDKRKIILEGHELLCSTHHKLGTMGSTPKVQYLGTTPVKAK